MRSTRNFLLSVSLLVSCVLSVTGPGVVFAQSRVGYGVMAGATDDLWLRANGESRFGWSAGASVLYPLPGNPYIEGDLVYDSFPSYCGLNCDSPFFQHVSVKKSAWSGTANIVWAAPNGDPSAITPFLMGGGGIYHFGLRYANDKDQGWTSPGIDLGAGLKIPLSGFNTSVDARWNHLFDKSKNGGSATSYIRIVAAIHTR